MMWILLKDEVCCVSYFNSLTTSFIFIVVLNVFYLLFVSLNVCVCSLCGQVSL